MRVTLATIHARDGFLPLALMYLKAMLIERGGLSHEDVPIVEGAPDADADWLAERILSTSPDLVGLSCYVWNVERLLSVARTIRQKSPMTLIVLGGPEVGPVAPSVLARETAVDVIVRSEGEDVLLALVAAVRDTRGFGEVAGICFREKASGAVQISAEAPIRMTLDELPSPRQLAADFGSGRRAAVETQRGCPFRCNFCFYNKDLSIRNRRFGLDRVQREIEFWLQQDILELYLMDPVFNLNAARAKDICRFVAATNLKGVPVHAEIWAEFVDDELASLMAAAGFRYLEVGLQTVDEVVLATVERRLRMAPFLEGLAALKRHGLRYELQLIYGLPGETPASFRRALDFAAAQDPPKLNVFLLMVLPGTELWNKAESLGLRFQAGPPYFVESHPTMSREDVADGRRLIGAQRWFRRSATIRLLSRWPGVGLSRVLDAWVASPASLKARLEPVEPSVEFLRDFAATVGVPEAFLRPLLDRDRVEAFGDVRVWQEAETG